MSTRQAVQPRISRLFTFLGFLIFFGFLMFPVIWIILMSIKKTADIIAFPPRFIFTPTIQNYLALIGGASEELTLAGRSDFLMYLRNSLITSLSSVMVSLVVGIPAAYALAKYKFRFRDSMAFTFLSFRFAPELTIIIPLYVLFYRLGLYNTFSGLIFVHQTITLPLIIWIMRGFFQEVPSEIIEAAQIDGCTWWQALLRVILPVARPGIASAVILAFIFSWNNLVFGLILAGPETQPVTIGILKSITYTEVLWGQMAASAVISILPGLIVSFFVQKLIVRGLTLGAVKG